VTPQSISFTNAGAIVQSTTDVTFTASINIFPFSSNALPANIIVHNASLLTGKTVRINAGVFNGQTVTIVNVDNIAITVDLFGVTKTLAGSAVLIAVWSTVSNKWTSN